MSTTPPADAPPAPGPAPDTGPRVSRHEVRDLARLRRTVGPDRRLAGVAGGLARHLDVDPVIVRVLLVVLVFFGGAGVVLYVACWLLVPEDGTDRAAVGLADRSRTFVLAGVGGLALLAVLLDSVGQWGFPWPLVVVAVVALLVLTLVDRDRNRPLVTAPPVPHHVDPVTGAATPAAPGDYYAGPPPPAIPWPTPTHVAPPPPHHPAARPPRRRGPILFWFTLALALVACGGLAIAAGAGATVTPSAYAAAVLGCCGLMLVVGSVYGRGGGLVLLGLVASAALLVASLLGPWHGSGDLHPTPSTAAEVQDRYRLTTGQITLDLSRVQDPQALDGRTVDLSARAGRIEVIVPAGLDVTATGHVGAAGQISLFDRLSGGSGGFDLTDQHTTAAGTPHLELDARVGVGEIVVHTEGAVR